MNFASEKARIKYNPANTTPEILRKAISDAGYEASEITVGPKDYSEHSKRKNEIQTWKTRFVSAAILSLPMAIFMVFDFVSLPKYEAYIMPYMAFIS